MKRLRGLSLLSMGVIALLGIVFWLMLPRVTSGPASPRTICRNNLKFIGLAMQQYHKTYGSLPPAYIPDAHGQPKHSWRVLLLPFLEEQALYDAYDLSEPWNGPNNVKLADELAKSWGKDGQPAMPYHFACPSSPQQGKTTTDYVAIVGERFAFDRAEPRKFGDFRDDLTTTILIVEVSNSGISWMEPRDLRLDQIVDGRNQRLISMSRHTSGFNALFCNGEVRFLPTDIRAATFEAMLTTDGDETIDSNEF